MKRIILKAMTIAMAMALTLVMTVPAFAQDYTGVTGPKVTVKKYVVVDKDVTQIPSGNITFNVAAGTAAEYNATNGTLAVNAGINPGSVKVANNGTLAVGGEAPTTNGASGDGIADSTDKKYTEYSFNIDFSGVTFTKPGVYRYVVSEDSITAPGMNKRTGYDTLTVDVYVVDINGRLEASSAVTYKGTVTAPPKAAATGNATPNGAEPAGATKDDKFINDVTTATLKVDKMIAGNQGDKSASFDIEITISGLTSGQQIGRGTADSGKFNPSQTVSQSFTADTSGVVTCTVKLSHNEQLVLTGIPVTSNTKYSVAETDSKVASEGYTKSGEVSNATLDDNKTVTIKNTKNGDIPTGVLTKMLPGLVLIGIAVLLLSRRRRTQSR